MMTTDPTTVRHKIGTCPGCKCGIWADVEIVTEVAAPTMNSDGKAQAYANARIVSARMSHLCSRAEDGGWKGTDAWPTETSEGDAA